MSKKKLTLIFLKSTSFFSRFSTEFSWCKHLSPSWHSCRWEIDIGIITNSITNRARQRICNEGDDYNTVWFRSQRDRRYVLSWKDESIESLKFRKYLACFSRTVDFGAGYFNRSRADFLFCLQIDSQTIEKGNSSIIQINRYQRPLSSHNGKWCTIQRNFWIKHFISFNS